MSSTYNSCVSHHKRATTGSLKLTYSSKDCVFMNHANMTVGVILFSYCLVQSESLVTLDIALLICIFPVQVYETA